MVLDQLFTNIVFDFVIVLIVLWWIPNQFYFVTFLGENSALETNSKAQGPWCTRNWIWGSFMQDTYFRPVSHLNSPISEVLQLCPITWFLFCLFLGHSRQCSGLSSASALRGITPWSVQGHMEYKWNLGSLHARQAKHLVSVFVSCYWVTTEI